MRTSRTIAMGLALAALVAGALPAAAQDEPALEGTQWALVSYAEGSGMTDVPVGIDASLLLEDGNMSGSSGCNSFSGSYTLEAASLDFDDALTTTLRACIGDANDVESAYYDALAQVAAWSIAGDTLELSDFDDEAVLVFETSTSAALSAGDVARLLGRVEALEAQVARNGERIDSISIAKLRERIRSLEATSEALRSQLAQLRAGSGGSGSGSGSESSTGFDAAEKALLEGVPSRFHPRCQPLRSGLPSGTAAAISCRPNTTRVAEMAYYLMEADPAVRLFSDRMSAAGVEMWGDIVPEGTQLCDDGVPSSTAAGGGYIGLSGCYRENGKANLRIVEQLTSCKQLKAGSEWIERPVMYVALEGPDANIKALDTWAHRNPGTNMSPLIVPLGNTSERNSPDCFAS